MAEPGYIEIRNIATAFFIVALIATCYRCVSRYRLGFWWHDDSVALFSALSFIMFVVGFTLFADESSTQGERVVALYLVFAGYHFSVWGARISIVLTVIRVTPWPLQRRILLGVIAFFVLLFAILISQAYWECDITHSAWKHIPGDICRFPRIVPIFELTAAVISDAILIATPLMILRGVCVRALRFRLFSIFSVSIATTLASLGHTILGMVKPGGWQIVFGSVEIVVSLLVCNMSVIIPAILRALGVGDPFMREDTVVPNFSSIEMAHAATTRIELGLPKTRGTAITNSSGSEGGTGTMGSQQLRSADFDAKDDRKYQFTMQGSEGSLGKHQDIETGVGEQEQR